MTDPREDQLRDRLQDLAGRASTSYDPTGPALRLARGLRNRRRAGVAAAGTAILAAAVPAAMVWTGPPPTAPAGYVTASPSPPNEVKVTLDLDALPLGDPPAVPWYADRTIHSGDQAIPVDFAGALLKLSEVPTGFVAYTDTREPGYIGRQVLIVRPDGKRELLAGGAVGSPVVSSDGRQVAWTEPQVGDATEVAIASTETGQVVARKRLPTSYGDVGATGFVGDRVLLTGDSDQTVVWDPAGDEVSRWAANKNVILVDPTGRIAVENATPDSCYRIIRTSDQAEVWKICGTSPVAFSADGSELVAGSDAQLGVLDLTAKRSLVSVHVDHPDRAAFEPSGDVVFQAWQGDRSALVRCATNGRCELATEPKAGDHDNVQKQPYFVGQRAQ